MSVPLTYDPPEPQVGDSELVIQHKTAVNMAFAADASGDIIDRLDTLITIIGTPTDTAGMPTLMGQLLQIAANTTPP